MKGFTPPAEGRGFSRKWGHPYHMVKEEALKLKRFQFRGLHPHVSIGTASDRYAGWIGQIYSEERYKGRISTRTHTIGSQFFQEEVLPVESVEEYFQHFPVLELDFTFYGVLLGEDRKPTSTYRVLHAYRRHLSPDDRPEDFREVFGKAA